MQMLEIESERAERKREANIAEPFNVCEATREEEKKRENKNRANISWFCELSYVM